MAAAAGGGGADAALYDQAVPDPDNTLGGIHGDTDPEHPSVVVHMSACGAGRARRQSSSRVRALRGCGPHCAAHGGRARQRAAPARRRGFRA